MQDRFGKSEFEIIPETYILPDEFADFYSHYHLISDQQASQKEYLLSKNKLNSSRNYNNKMIKNAWIVKPNGGGQGRGIFITDDITNVPIDEEGIVSRYITNPMLIKGLKFDLRIYVLVTSFDPWRIYIYQEGLVRFASEEYKDCDFDNKFMHLTNYSINKKNEKFKQSNTYEAEDSNKWSFSLLSKHLEAMGVNISLLWSRIYDVILKTFLAGEPKIIDAGKKIPNYKNNSFEIFGFDIMIDSDCRPWILEANLSPSFATDSLLDYVIKSNLLKDTMNMLFMKKNEKKKAMPKEDSKFKASFRSKLNSDGIAPDSPEKHRSSSFAPYMDSSKKYVIENLAIRNKQLFNVESILNDFKDK